jgi:hypothetical protein
LMNCIDVVAGSTAKAVLLVRDPPNEAEQEQAIDRGVGVVSSFEEAVDVLEHLHETLRDRRGRLQRLADWFTGPKAEGGLVQSSPDPDRARLRDE